jgi:serine/threonine protein kinase
MSPEIIKKQFYNGFKADIWALGVLTYFLLKSSYPFKGNSEKEIFSRILAAQYQQLSQTNFEAKHLI